MPTLFEKKRRLETRPGSRLQTEERFELLGVRLRRRQCPCYGFFWFLLAKE